MCFVELCCYLAAARGIDAAPSATTRAANAASYQQGTTPLAQWLRCLGRRDAKHKRRSSWRLAWARYGKRGCSGALACRHRSRTRRRTSNSRPAVAVSAAAAAAAPAAVSASGTAAAATAAVSDTAVERATAAAGSDATAAGRSTANFRAGERCCERAVQYHFAAHPIPSKDSRRRQRCRKGSKERLCDGSLISARIEHAADWS